MANQVLGTLTMDDLSALRKMKPVDAEMFLSKHQLSDGDKMRLKDIIGRDLTDDIGSSMIIHLQDPSRPLWVLAAWLAGASWRQIARLHGVAPQTIMAAADRLLVSSLRQPQRLRTSMTLEALDSYRATFIKNVASFRLMTPQQVAMWLLDNTELDKDA